MTRVGSQIEGKHEEKSTYLDLLKLLCLRHHTKHTLLRHQWLKEVIEGLDGRILYVKVTSDSTQISGVEITRDLIEADHVRFVQGTASLDDQLVAIVLKTRITLETNN